MTQPIEFRLRYVLDSGTFDRAIAQSTTLTKGFEGTISGVVERIGALGGASGRAAQQQAQAAGSSAVFFAALERQVAALQSQSAAIGKSEGDLLRLKAAELGVAASAEGTIAALERQSAALVRQAGTQRILENARAINAEREAIEAGIAVDLRAGQAKRDLIAEIEREAAALRQLASAPVSRGTQATGGLEKRVAAVAATDPAFAAQAQPALSNLAAAQAAQQSNAFIAALERTANAAGRTRAELLQLQAAELGVADKAAPLIRRIADVDKGFQSFNKSGRLTALELQQIGYQINDFAVQVASGQNVLTAFVQQGSQLSGTFGGIGAAARALVSLITPLRVGIGAVVAAVVGLVYAWREGANQSKAFADAIVLSGNAAGITEGQYNSLAKSIAATGQVNIAAARRAASALIATGQIGPSNLAAATEAAARYADATGKSADEVAKDFAEMGRDAHRWAVDHNRSLNFITAAQAEHIRRLQEQGRQTQAAAIIYDALNDKLRDLEPNLGHLDRAIRATTNTWKGFWDAAFDIGRADTLEDRLAKATQRLIEWQRRAAQVRVAPPTQAEPDNLFARHTRAAREARAAGAAEEEARARREVHETRRLIEIRQGEAAAKAMVAEANKAAIAADDFARGILRSAQNSKEVNRQLAEAERHFAANARAASLGLAEPISQEDQQTVLYQIRTRFQDKEAKQRSANTIREAQRTADAEKAIVEQSNEELRAEYDTGLITITEYYDRRIELAGKSAQAERARINTVIEALQLEKRADINPLNRDAAQARIDEERINATQARAEAARQLERIEREGTRDQLRLNDSLIQQEAEIAQLRGRDAQAEALRNQLRVEQFALLNRQAGGPQQRVADFSAALQQATALRDVQNQLGDAAERASLLEEEFIVVAARNAQSLEETEQGIYQIRQQSLEQLNKLVAKLQELAAVSEDPQALLLAQRWSIELQKAAEDVDPFLVRLRSLAEDVGQALVSSFADAALEGGNLADVIRQIDRQLARLILNELAVKPLEKSITNLIRGEGDANLKRVVAPGSASIDVGALGGFVGRLFGGGAQNTSQESFRQQEIASQNATDAIGKMAVAAMGSSDVLGQLPQLAAIPATVSLNTLSGAAQIAANALLQLAGSKAATDSGGIFKSILGLFTGGSGLPSNLMQVGQEPPGFDEGGFTGAMPTTEVAGYVHGKEFVFSAPAVERIGVPALESMHKAARGYSEGGYVAPAGESVFAMSIASVRRSLPGYYEGGYAGMRPAGEAQVQRRWPGESYSATSKDSRPVIVNVRGMPGQSRDTVMQQGYAIGRAARIASRRNG